MRKGKTHAAYEVLRQLGKPKCQSGSQLRHKDSRRQHHRASKCIAEWLWHVTQLFIATSPIVPDHEVLALPPLSSPHAFHLTLPLPPLDSHAS